MSGECKERVKTILLTALFALVCGAGTAIVTTAIFFGTLGPYAAIAAVVIALPAGVCLGLIARLSCWVRLTR